MISDPLVSILIPAYNSEKWIADTILSALKQTWTKVEIIIVDDGSKDGTLEIASRFASSKVQVVSQSNSGAAQARNTAISLSKGDYIQWLDADDLLHPDKVRLQVEALGHCASDRILLSSGWGYFFHRPENASFVPTALWCDLTPAEWMMRQMEQNLHMQTATWLVSRKLTQVAGPWDARMLVDDDGEYFCRMMTFCDGIRFVDGAKTFYRRSGTGSVSYIGASNPKKDAQFLSMRLHIDYLLSLEDSSRARAASVRYLQNWLIHFHPERPDIVSEAKRLAKTLGGTLHEPRLPAKYRAIQKVFGTNCARRLQLLLPSIKNQVLRTLDKAISSPG